MYDAFYAVYTGQYANGTFLQILQVEKASTEDTQNGGTGAGKFDINTAYESTTNLVAPNRIDGYRRASQLRQSINSSQTALAVSHVNQFAVGDSIVIYDGVHYDFASVTVIDTVNRVLTISPAPFYAYALDTTVLKQYYRGRISMVEKMADFNNLQQVSTVGYFQEIADFVPTDNINGYECGWVIQQLLTKYATSLDFNIVASNIVQDSTGKGTGGTGIFYTGNATNTPLATLLNEIVTMANGNLAGTIYRLYCDVFNTIYFKAINSTTPTVTLNINSYNDSFGDGLYDLVSKHSTHAEDLTGIKNTYKLVGGTNTSTQQPVTVTVFDQISVNQYGQKEAVISNPSLTSVDALKSWGVGQLNRTAYPLQQYVTELSLTGSFVSCTDYVKIQGFTDSSTILYTPIAVETIWDCTKFGQFAQKITGAEMLPDVNRAVRNIQAEHFIPTIGVLAGTVNLTDRFVQTGLQGSYTGNVFTLSSGIINANVFSNNNTQLTEFDITAQTYSPPTEDTYTIAYKYRNTDGTLAQYPGIVTYFGINTPAGVGFTDYQVIPLYLITRLNGQIVNALDKRNIGGIKTANINAGAVGGPQFAPNPALSTPPALAASTSVSGPVYSSVGLSLYDAALTFTLSTTTPSWLAGLRQYAVNKNATFNLAQAINIGDLPPANNGVYSAIYQLTAGQAYDLYVAFIDHQNNVGTPLKLATTTANPLQVYSANLATMPTSGGPSIIGTPSLTYPDVGLATYSADVVFQLSPAGTTASNWLAAIDLVAQPVGQTNNWVLYNTTVANNSGAYNDVWGGLGAGNMYQLGLRFRDFANNVSAVTGVGTTTANPIAGAAIATGAIGAGQTNGIFDSSGQLIYSLSPAGVKTAVSSTGQVNVSSASGTLPYANTNIAFTATIAPAPTNGTYLANSAVSTPQVQAISINKDQLVATRYSSSLANTANSYNGYLWYLNGTGAITSSTAIADGSIVDYNVGTQTDASSNNPASNTLTLAANASCYLYFEHTAFKAGGNGQISIGFAGASVSQSAFTASSTSVSGSDQPTITHTTGTSSTQTQYSTTFSNINSTAQIQEVLNTGYSAVQHNSGYVNPNYGSSASITGGTAYNSVTGTSVGTSISMGVQTTTAIGLNCDTSTNGTKTTTNQAINNSIAIQNIDTASNASTDASHAISLAVTLPSTVSLGTTTSIYNTCITNIHGVCSCTSHAASSTSATPAISWNLQLVRLSDNAVVYGASSISTSSTFNYYGTGQTGTFRWKLTPQYNTNSGTAAVDGSGTSTGAVTPGWFTTSTTYVQNNGVNVLLAQTGGSALAPSVSNPIKFHVNATAIASNAQGTGAVNLIFVDPTGAQTFFTNVQPNTDYQVTAGPAGNWLIYYYSSVTTNNNGTSPGFASNMDGYFYWYQSDAYSYYNYNNLNGTTTSYNTNTATSAPTVAGTAITCVISTLNLPSNAYGSSGLEYQLFDPSNNLVASQAIGGPGTFTFNTSSAAAGQYQARLYAYVATDNQTNGSLTSVGSQSYIVNFTGYIGYYINVSSTGTQYYNNSGQSFQYLTASTTTAPVSAVNQLTLDLTSVTTPGNAYGQSSIYVQLLDPNGVARTFSYNAHYNTTTGTDAGNIVAYQGATTFTYFNATAIAGVWKWIVYGQVASNNTGDSQYSVSWTGTEAYYTPGLAGGNTYVLASDGLTQRTNTNDGDVNYYRLAPNIAAFQVFNNAAQNITFQISMDVKAV